MYVCEKPHPFSECAARASACECRYVLVALCIVMCRASSSTTPSHSGNAFHWAKIKIIVRLCKERSVALNNILSRVYRCCALLVIYLCTRARERKRKGQGRARSHTLQFVLCSPPFRPIVLLRDKIIVVIAHRYPLPQLPTSTTIGQLLPLSITYTVESRFGTIHFYS